MNPETVKAIQDALTPMAEKLGQGASELFRVYVQQMFAEAIMSFIFFGFMLVLFAVSIPVTLKAYRYSKKWAEEKNKGKDYNYTDAGDHGSIWFAGIFSVAFMVLSIVGLVNSIEAVGKIINPEYYAIERIINQVKGQ